jgi:hypothetical protein
MCGQIQPVMTGLPQTWVDLNFQGGVIMGSTKTIPLPVGGDFKMVQAQPQTLTGDSLDRKERQMVALGARLVEQRSVQRTLGEKRLEYATEISVLESCASNVADGYVQAFKWAGQFIDGDPGDPQFELYPEFELEKMTPEEIKTVQGLQQGRLITWDEARTKLKQGGYATEDNEVAREIIDSEKPAGGVGVIGSVGFNKQQQPPMNNGDPAQQ